MNKGKIAADERTDKLTEMMTGTRRLQVRIAGARKEILDALNAIPEVSYVDAGKEVNPEDGVVYKIESKDGQDIRRQVFEVCAQKHAPILGMETVTASLEDVFMNLTRESVRKKVRSK